MRSTPYLFADQTLWLIMNPLIIFIVIGKVVLMYRRAFFTLRAQLGASSTGRLLWPSACSSPATSNFIKILSLQTAAAAPSAVLSCQCRPNNHHHHQLSSSFIHRSIRQSRSPTRESSDEAPRLYFPTKYFDKNYTRDLLILQLFSFQSLNR